MSDPARFLDDDDVPEQAKSLLRSWSSRQPSEAARLRTLAALGVSGALGGALAGGGASLAPKAAVATASVVKWLALASGVVATVGTVTYVAIQRSNPGGPAPPPRVVETAPAPPSPSAQASTPESTESPKGAPTAVPSVGAPAALPASIPKVLLSPTAAPGVRSTPPPSTSTLQEEVELIDSGRRALSGGDAQATLELVDAYDARFPGGALSQESEELRIEALFRTAKRPEAEKRAARFLAGHPTSPYARVIRGLLAAPAGPTR